jgi:hypothetical protein
MLMLIRVVTKLCKLDNLAETILGMSSEIYDKSGEVVSHSTLMDTKLNVLVSIIAKMPKP